MKCLCGHDGWPVQVLGVSGRGAGDAFLPPMADACAKCGRVFDLIQVAPTNGHSALVEAPMTPAPRAKAPPPTDIVSMVRDRLAALETEIAVLEAKKAEADTLRRMLSVANVPARGDRN